MQNHVWTKEGCAGHPPEHEQQEWYPDWDWEQPRKRKKLGR